MPISALALCSRALLRLGAQPIASFTEGTAEAEIAANLYPGIRDALLSAHPWSFASGQADLPRLADTPFADFTRCFQLPPDFLRALSAGSGGRGRGATYRIHEDRLHADAEAITLTYVFRPDESAFPAFFAAALVARLAAEFCLPLTESVSRAEALFRLAEQELRAARQADSQQATIRAIEGFPLVDIRG
ncbi:hypothetical protein [Falsiroseomonas oryziterrae]|uniref:hypothetical protein n=1 Tax=Falsiroseomonas oryziterrae TaxID=2911368 RepID=UPI001F1C82B5|nr:hypothetical protein [Roseomonas sp. NPKOSM-4]